VPYIDPWNKVLRFPEHLVKMQKGERVWPINIEFDLSNACNLRCRHCSFEYTHDNTTMPEDLARRVIEECADVGVKALTFTGGGEPTTHPRFPELCQFAHEKGLKVGLYTNGLRRDMLMAAVPYLSWVYFSLDEVTPEQYKFTKGVNCFFPVVGAIGALAGKTTVGVGYLLHGGNYHQAHRMIALAKDYGADYAQLRPVVGLSDYDWMPTCLTILRTISDPFVYISYRRFEDLLHNQEGKYQRGYTVCRASEVTPCVGADGTLWACPNTRGLRALGDLKTESFREIWERREPQCVSEGCRIACRNDALNETLEYVCGQGQHTEFV